MALRNNPTDDLENNDSENQRKFDLYTRIGQLSENLRNACSPISIDVTPGQQAAQYEQAWGQLSEAVGAALESITRELPVDDLTLVPAESRETFNEVPHLLSYAAGYLNFQSPPGKPAVTSHEDAYLQAKYCVDEARTRLTNLRTALTPEIDTSLASSRDQVGQVFVR